MPKSFFLHDIADAVGGTLLGDGNLQVSRLAHPADLQDRGDLALAMEPKLLALVKPSPAQAAVITAEGEAESGHLKGRIVVTRPRLAMARLTALFAAPVAVPSGIHPSAVIEAGAKLGKNVTVGAQSYIGVDAVIGDHSVLHPQTYIGPGAKIGAHALIYPGARIGDRVQIGDRIIIHFNASIGADGFSFVTPEPGSVEAAKASQGNKVEAANTHLIRIASLGAVIIGDDVEIGANSSIDRGTITSTRIGTGTKIDNQVQIGHNVVIGENCLICGRTGIAGSAIIGNRVVLGGAVGVADHVQIGDDAVAMAMSGIAGNIAPRTVVGGIPALPRDEAYEQHFNLRRLKGLFRKIEDLGRRMAALEQAHEKG
jgi:UDP-3-O-[3-hydroxymyristoyl] glucosamine N-acyltransferase